MVHRRDERTYDRQGGRTIDAATEAFARSSGRTSTLPSRTGEGMWVWFARGLASALSAEPVARIPATWMSAFDHMDMREIEYFCDWSGSFIW